MTYFINFLTLSRIFLGSVIFLLLTRPEGYFLAFILFFVAGATDYFDGYLARKYISPGGGIGRHKGLKIPRQQWRAGSSPAPAPGTS